MADKKTNSKKGSKTSKTSSKSSKSLSNSKTTKTKEPKGKEAKGAKSAKKAKSTEPLFDPSKHMLVPKHEVLSDAEREELFKKYNITIMNLPKIMLSDPALKGLSVKEGDVIKITRPSKTAGEAVFYRGVVND